MNEKIKNFSHTPITECTLDALQHNVYTQITTTNNSFIIQGQAGTGKSTFIKYLQTHCKKKMRLLCPTAIAGLNIGGATIHSLFRLPFKDFFIKEEVELKPKTRSILKKTDIIVIDEISMVRPDVLDVMDFLLKKARGNFTPFGGVQMVFVGDLCQLPPIIKREVEPIFKEKYGFANSYFFDAASFKSLNPTLIEFTTVYRQNDTQLLKMLNNLRKNNNLSETLTQFNQLTANTSFNLEEAITITPYKIVAENINTSCLNEIKSPPYIYESSATGYFVKSTESPAPRQLKLKKEAVVLLNKNNPPLWINGSTGVVVELEEDTIWIRLFAKNKLVPVKREVWESFSYEYDKKTDTVIERQTGSFTQFPIQLGYALTIHKAQGKTLDNVIIDMNRGAFAHGQAYVALSRTRKATDMYLLKPINASDIILDSRVMQFLQQRAKPA